MMAFRRINVLVFFFALLVVSRAIHLPRSTCHKCRCSRGVQPRIKTKSGSLLGARISRVILGVRGGARGDRPGDDGSRNSTYPYDNEPRRYYDQGQGDYDDRDWKQHDEYYSRGRNDYTSDPYLYDDRGYNDRGYDDRGRKGGSQSGAVQESLSSLSSKFKYGDRRIGTALLGMGTLFTMLGVSLFFNKSLMRMGNLLFIAGVPMTIGPTRCASYLFNPKKARASACLVVGIFFVFVGWPIVGICLEAFGILNLFGNMFPIAWAIVKNMPIVSSIFNSNSAGSGGNNRRNSERFYDDYDDGQSYGDNRQYNYDDDYPDDDPDDSRFY